MISILLLFSFALKAIALDVEINNSPSPYTHQIDVGNNQDLENPFVFAPNQINANIGDRIVFKFHGVNHTLTQSSLDLPCQPIHQFDTGFGQFNPSDQADISISITVTTLDPQWFYCHQDSPLSHCHEGMVFAINPGQQDMRQFLKNAKKARGVWKSQSGSQKPTGTPISTPPVGYFTPLSSMAAVTTSLSSTVADVNPNGVASTTSTGSPRSSIRSKGYSTSIPHPSVIVMTKTITKECTASSPSPKSLTIVPVTTDTSPIKSTVVRSEATTEVRTGSAWRLVGILLAVKFGFLFL